MHITRVRAQRPDDGLQILQLDEWPGTDPDRFVKSDRRIVANYEAFRDAWNEINVRLKSVGEQPLSTPEFVALRLCTHSATTLARTACGSHHHTTRHRHLTDTSRQLYPYAHVTNCSSLRSVAHRYWAAVREI